MEELDKLISELESKIEEMILHTDILIRCKGDSKEASKMLLHKNIEDGMIENFHNAAEYQLNRLRPSYGGFKWIYHDKDYVEKRIDLEILRKKRENKLKRIVSEE